MVIAHSPHRDDRGAFGWPRVHIEGVTPERIFAWREVLNGAIQTSRLSASQREFYGELLPKISWYNLFSVANILIRRGLADREPLVAAALLIFPSEEKE